MFGFKKKEKEESKRFRIVVNQAQQRNDSLSIDVLDEASNELLLSQSIEQPHQPLPSSLSQQDDHSRDTFSPTSNSETQRLSLELNEMRKMFAEYGIDKLRDQQRILQSQNADLQNQILARQSLVTELEKTLQIMKEGAVDTFRQNIDAYGLKFIADFMNKA